MSMCEDYPCCGHTPADPCGDTGPTAEDYLSLPNLDLLDYYIDENGTLWA